MPKNHSDMCGWCTKAGCGDSSLIQGWPKGIIKEEEIFYHGEGNFLSVWEMSKEI